MKYATLRDAADELAELNAKKRLGKNQKATHATLTEQLSQMTPTPRRAPTGNRADYQGNVYLQHKRQSVTIRETRRANKFGRNGGIQPFRSRIQRQTRKRRTGGVR